MSDPLILTDYEFHFKSGDLLFVTVQDGRDFFTVEPDGRIVIVINEIQDTEERHDIDAQSLERTKRTQRLIREQPAHQGVTH